MISNPSPTSLNYFKTLQYCSNLIESGFSDWRIPTIEEVEKYIELNGLNYTLVTWTKSRLSTGQIIVLIDPLLNSFPSYPYYIDSGNHYLVPEGLSVNSTFNGVNCVR